MKKREKKYVDVEKGNLEEKQTKTCWFENMNWRSILNVVVGDFQALTMEVGDNMSIQACLNSTSGWRGRAQTIIQLQQKVSFLCIMSGQENSSRPIMLASDFSARV